MDLVEDALSIQDQLVELRRQIHQEPEVGLTLPLTQQRVLAALNDLGLSSVVGTGLSSVVAVLRGGRSTGRSVLLRADMDALPVREQTGLEFASPGDAMHACGHDLHTTMLVGAAQLLSAHRESLAGDVVFMFQPGEEGYDGARQMIEAGVLEAAGGRVDAAFALHVTSSMFGSGVVATRPGPLMAAADVLRVTVRGRGGHASAPHRACDPIPAAAEMVTALQTLVTRTFDVFDPVVITVGAFHAGTQHNIIPDLANFEATVRSFSPEAQARAAEAAVRLCRGIAAAYGLQADVEWQTLYPPTVNEPAESRFVSDLAAEMFGASRSVTMPVPMTGAEDFSRVIQAVPGSLAFLGACPPGADPATAPFNHSPVAVFDEGVLKDGAALYAQFAASRLEALVGAA